MKISVITPTYNRAYILKNCYESLCKQTSTDFEWIVIDDGSTDETEMLVKGFINQNKIAIKYIKQENAGKHIAHNTGVLNSNGELVVCLDSDDMLTEDAIEEAVRFWKENATEKNTGILAKRGKIDTREPICSSWSKELKQCTMFDLTSKYGFHGDTILFFKREILRDNLFKHFKNEKFIPENNMYIDVDKNGKMLLLDKVLYLCEYLPDGLTAKFHSLLVKNPNGTADTYYKQLCMADNLKLKSKYAVLTNIYLSLSTNRKELNFNKNKFWLFLFKIPALLVKNRFLNKF